MNVLIKLRKKNKSNKDWTNQSKGRTDGKRAKEEK